MQMYCSVAGIQPTVKPGPDANDIMHAQHDLQAQEWVYGFKLGICI